MNRVSETNRAAQHAGMTMSVPAGSGIALNGVDQLLGVRRHRRLRARVDHRAAAGGRLGHHVALAAESFGDSVDDTG